MPNNGCFVMETGGPQRGLLKQLASGPNGCEVCGCEFTPDGRTLFLSIQHPGRRRHARQAAQPLAGWQRASRARRVAGRRARGRRAGLTFNRDVKPVQLGFNRAAVELAAMEPGLSSDFSPLLVLLAALGGCASLSKNECLNANWEDIGIRDGANGRPEEYLIQHSKACAKVGVTPDRGAWLTAASRASSASAFRIAPIKSANTAADSTSASAAASTRTGSLDAYDRGREVHRLGSRAEFDRERDATSALASKRSKESRSARRNASVSMYRLGRLEYQRDDAQRAYDEARYRARDL